MIKYLQWSIPYLCSNKFEPLGNKLAQAREWKLAAASFVPKYLQRTVPDIQMQESKWKNDFQT